MTRLGWSILFVILAAGGLFLSMVRVSDAPLGGLRDRARARISEALPGVVQSSTRLLVPVRGVSPATVAESWGDARSGGSRAHQGTDIAAPQGTPVLAAAAGTVEKLFRSDAGGITLYVRSPDRRYSYYYAHLAGYAPGMAEGLRVRAGDRLGRVGDTGNAGAGNYHLHFGMSRMRPGDRWWQGAPVDPYPMLARAGVAR